jgi:outer membrane biosynthesis protein TonB
MTRPIDATDPMLPEFPRRSPESPEVWLVQLFGALVLHAGLLFGVRLMWAEITVEEPQAGAIEFVEVGTVDQVNERDVQPDKAEGVAPTQPAPVAQQPQTTLQQPEPEPIAQVTPSPEPSVPPSSSPIVEPTPQPTPRVTPTNPPATPTPKPIKPGLSTPTPTATPTAPIGSGIQLPPTPPPPQNNGIGGGGGGAGEGGKESIGLKGFTPTPCQRDCQHQAYQLLKGPSQVATLSVKSPSEALPPGVMQVDVTFEVARSPDGTAILANESLIVVQSETAKLTPEQQKTLTEAVQKLLAQCQFQVTVDGTYTPVDRVSKYLLEAQVQLQVL